MMTLTPRPGLYTKTDAWSRAQRWISRRRRMTAGCFCCLVVPYLTLSTPGNNTDVTLGSRRRQRPIVPEDLLKANQPPSLCKAQLREKPVLPTSAILSRSHSGDRPVVVSAASQTENRGLQRLLFFLKPSQPSLHPHHQSHITVAPSYRSLSLSSNSFQPYPPTFVTWSQSDFGRIRSHVTQSKWPRPTLALPVNKPDSTLSTSFDPAFPPPSRSLNNILIQRLDDHSHVVARGPGMDCSRKFIVQRTHCDSAQLEPPEYWYVQTTTHFRVCTGGKHLL